jgi:hypothetical protein
VHVILRNSDATKMIVKCAECECTPIDCNKREYSAKKIGCINCRKQDKCCCMDIHFIDDKNQCCNDSSCARLDISLSGLTPQVKPENNIRPPSQSNIGNETRSFFSYAKSLYAAALGIEILCIAAAEIGENTGLYVFGFNAHGIAIAYMMGYALAGFVTFVTILGRYGNHRQRGKGRSIEGIDSCCSVLEQDSTQRFIPNLKTTFTNFASGFKHLFSIRRQRGMKTILKSSLFILVTAESACILTAETVDLIFYQYSILLSVPLALLAGAFTVVAPAAYRKSRQSDTTAKTAKTS